MLLSPFLVPLFSCLLLQPYPGQFPHHIHLFLPGLVHNIKSKRVPNIEGAMGIDLDTFAVCLPLILHVSEECILIEQFAYANHSTSGPSYLPHFGATSSAHQNQQQGQNDPTIPAQAAHTPFISPQRAHPNPTDTGGTSERPQPGNKINGDENTAPQLGAAESGPRLACRSHHQPSTPERLGTGESGLTRAHNQGGSPRHLDQDFGQEGNQLEDESSTIQDSFPGQATHGQESPTSTDSLPGQRELFGPLSLESGLLTLSPFRIGIVIAAR